MRSRQPQAVRLPLSRRLRFFPVAAQLLLAVWLLCALAPPSAALWARVMDPSGATLIGAVARHSLGATVAAVVIALLALFAYERPRSASPRAYLLQLCSRWTALLSQYDEALAAADAPRPRPRSPQHP